MTQDLTAHPRYEEARKRAEGLRAFYTHALVYIVVNLGLMALSYFGNLNGRWWPNFAAIGWGIGLAIHGLSVFVFYGFLGVGWEQRKIREFLEKDRA